MRAGNGPDLLVEPDEIRRLVVVRPGRIGDFLCATPALRALRAALPSAELSLVGLPLVSDLAARSPHLDGFHAFPGFPGIAEQFFDARATTRFLLRLQEQRFDLAVQLYGSGVYSNPFTLLLGARRTAGFTRAGDDPGCLDAAVPLPEEGHEIDRVLTLPAFLGAPPRGRAMEFPLLRADHAAAENLLAGCTPPLIGLAPGARDRTRCWPAVCFAEVGRRLRERWGGTVVVLGGPGDPAGPAPDTGGAGRHWLDLTGRTTLPVLGAVISRLSLLVANDSGPAHVGYALAAPSVTVFLASDPARWGPPPGPRHRIVAPGAPGDPRGLVQPVLRAADDVLRTPLASPARSGEAVG